MTDSTSESDASDVEQNEPQDAAHEAVLRSALDRATAYDEMSWHTCDSNPNFSPLQCIKIKEKAIADAIVHIRKLLPRLEEQKDVLPMSEFVVATSKFLLS